MKQTYLCSSCKRIGLKTSKVMLFETFFCPKCKKNTTLFLSKPKQSQSIIPSPSVPPPIIETKAIVVPERQVIPEKQIERRSHLKLHHALLFLIGFISALLITKK